MNELVPLIEQLGQGLLEISRVLQRESEKNAMGQQLVDQHGEVVTKTGAMRILKMGHEKVTQMLDDGRLDKACEGTGVSVRSIARYMQNPKQADWNAAVQRRKAAPKRTARKTKPA